MQLALGVEFIVSTELDSKWSMRAQSGIVLDEGKRRQKNSPGAIAVSSSLRVVSMNRMKVGALDGLKSGILPVAPLTRTFAVLREWETDSFHRLSCPGSDDRILRG